MNIFYTPPGQVFDTHLELLGQEAVHASKVLRYRKDDTVTVVDGAGGWYEGVIRQVTSDTVWVEINHIEKRELRQPQLVLGLGIIKKRARLEFAVEKAVELGVSAIALFRSEHTVKENVRVDRLESLVLSAVKQSLQAWLPPVQIYDSVDEVMLANPDACVLAAHEKINGEAGIEPVYKKENKLLLLVGPEGGFSNKEIAYVDEQGGALISLGTNRLRTETAAVAFLSQFI